MFRPVRLSLRVSRARSIASFIPVRPVFGAGDDNDLVVMIRGGPEANMVSTWLQIMALRESDVGTYICVATNSEGEARAAAELSLMPAAPVAGPVEEWAGRYLVIEGSVRLYTYRAVPVTSRLV